MEPRGIRNCNPLNIRKSKDQWQGLRVVQQDKEFCQFESMEYGWRAAFVLLCRTYYLKYRLQTIRAIITRWAPPQENNTEAYIRRVAERTGIYADESLDPPSEHPTQWMAIAMAMAIVECGTTNLSPFAMLKGFSLALRQ